MSRPPLPILQYHGETIYFRFANAEDLDPENEDFKASSSEYERNFNILENQLIGPLRAFYLGTTFSWLDGTYAEAHTANTLNVTLSGWEGMIDRVAIGRGIGTLQWSNLSETNPNFLWAALVEEENQTGSFRSSAMKSDLDTLVTSTSTPPVNRSSALLATFTSGIGINTEPVGKITRVPSLGEHVRDNFDPHGTKLFQDNMVSSGVTVATRHTVEDFPVSGVIINEIQQGDFFSGLNMEHYIALDDVQVLGELLLHNDLTLSGSNILGAEEALLAALDRVKAGTIGALTILSGLEMRSEMTFREDVTVLSGKLVDGTSIAVLYGTMDSHIADTNNPHTVNSGQVTGEYVTELGGILSGDLIMLSGRTVDGVDLSEFGQFIDGSLLTERTHLHNTTSGIQFLGFAPEHSAVLVFEGSADDISYSFLSGSNVGVLSGVTGTMAVRTSLYLPDSFGSPISATFEHGFESSVSGIPLLFGGQYDQLDLDATLDTAKVVMNFDELGGDVSTGDRSNLVTGGVPAVFEEYSGGATTIPAADGIILSGADFESGGSAAELRPKNETGEIFVGENFVNISVWVKPESTLGTNYVLSEAWHAASASDTSPRFSIIQTIDNRIRVDLRRTDDITRTFQTAVVINDGVWNHIGVVFDFVTEEWEIYHNGVLSINAGITGSGSLDDDARSFHGAGLRIGARTESSEGGSPTFMYDGVIDRLDIVTDKRLNSDHMNEYYNSGAAVMFDPAVPGNVSMQIKDSDGSLISPAGASELQDAPMTKTTVDLVSSGMLPNTFVNVEYALSGQETDVLYFGPWSMKYQQG